ncbi:bifunctional DNA primase/polymerase [Chloroflexota bacterium]
MNIPELEYYQQQGLSFFPLPYQAKKDDGFKWGQFQKRLPTEAEVKHWFGNGTKHNIAVVCGQVSGGLVILDCDNYDRFFELATIITEKTGINDINLVTRMSETGKGVHIWLFVDEEVSSAKFPKLDIKAEGGYIVAPPSLHPEGREYKWINTAPIRRIASLKDIGIDLEQRRSESPEHSDNWVTEALKGIGEGGRNDTCYRLAAYFKNKHPQDITERLLLDWNKRNSPPMDEVELLQTISSAYRRTPLEPPTDGSNKESTMYYPSGGFLESQRYKSVTENVTKSRAEAIEEWVKDSNGWFSYEDIDREFNIRSEAEKLNRRVIIKRLRDAGIIEPHPGNNKLWRYKNVNVRLIDLKTATKRVPLGIKYPFHIEQYFNTYPGNIIALAGAADAGKTAFLLNFVKLNMYDFSIYYQSSEMGDAELYSRIENFEGESPEEWNFTPEERSRDFADVIRPDCVNIIDYLELAGDFYSIADTMRQIHDRLAGGIAIIALQKKRGAELGRGGDFGLEKPRLYLSMDKGKITIQKAKNWVDHQYNPNGLTLNFKIVAGCKFITTEDWHKSED